MNILEHDYTVAGFYILIGVLLGLLSEKVLLKKLKLITSKTSWKSDDIIIQSFHGIAFLWWMVLAVYFAIHQLNLPEKVCYVIEKLIFSSIVLSVSILVSRILIGLIKIKTQEDDRDPLPSTSIITNIVKFTIFTTGTLIILQSIGISITPLLTALGVGGLAVALALQETLTNLFAGIQIIASKQIKTGNYIKLSTGEEGVVEDIAWRNTSIKMLSNNLIVVPNSKIASALLTNYSLPEKETTISIKLCIAFENDLEKVEQLALEVAKEVSALVKGVVKNNVAIVHYLQFDEKGVFFTVSFKINEFSNQFFLKHEFIKALHGRFKKEGIKFVSK